MDERSHLLSSTSERRENTAQTRRKRRTVTITLCFVVLGILFCVVLLLFMGSKTSGKIYHLLYHGEGWDLTVQTENETDDKIDIEQEFQNGRERLKKKFELEEELQDRGIKLKEGTPAFYHQLFLKTSEQSRHLADCAFIAESIQRRAREINKDSEIKLECVWKNKTACRINAKYREFDGRCNNVVHPDWGSAHVPFIRLLEPDYADNLSLPRRSKSGNELPSARLISSSMYANKPHLESKLTLLSMLWGLFVDHDITNTAISQGKDGRTITCCDKEVIKNKTCLHPECYPIKIPKNDTFFGRHNITCMEFVRSSPAKANDSVYRQQLNQITSFLDGSAIYGSSEGEANSLRSFRCGRLKVSKIKDTEVLPMVTNLESFCGLPKHKLFCFHAGDRRANEQVELTVIHTIWMREHNRVSRQLESLNPHWNDEEIFQEARKIVVAELQHITYNEYLQFLFGDENLDKYNLRLLSDGYYDGYDPLVDPTASNVFAAAAFRFGHSQVQDFIELLSSAGKTIRQIPLHETFFNPTAIYEEGVDTVLRGITKQRSKAVWSQMTVEIQNRLFQSHYSHYGLDLSAISIQRGRDHGIPSYTNWRKYCRLSNVENWKDLSKILDGKNAKILESLYESVEDVDFIPAALSEKKTSDEHILGPTHSCLIAEQFVRFRNGDRFWYENKDIFTKDQLNEIRKVTLSRVICDNSDDLISIQKWPLYPLTKWNTEVFCHNSTDLPEIDLHFWTS